MDYGFAIYDNKTNERNDKYRSVGCYTSLSKTKAIEKAKEWLKNHNDCYAMLYSFDWKRGYKFISKIINEVDK